MDPSVIIAVLGLVSSVAGIIVANRYTARTARQAQLTTAQIEEKKLDVASWQEQVKSWRDDVKQLRELRAADKTDYEAQLIKMASRIDSLERDREREQRERIRERAHLDAMVIWGRIVMQILTSANIVFPPPPPGLADTHPHGYPTVVDEVKNVED